MTNKISDSESRTQITAFMSWRELEAPKEPAYNPNYNKPVKGEKPAWSKAACLEDDMRVSKGNQEVYS